MSLLSSLAIPEHRLLLVLGHACAVVVHDAEVVLGTGIAPYRQRTPLAQRGRVVLPPIRSQPIFKRPRQRRPRHKHKRDDQRFQLAHPSPR